MKTKLAYLIAGAACAAAATSPAAPARSELKVSADIMAADNVTGSLAASGHVNAVLAPFRMTSDAVSKVGNEYVFSEPTVVTTCTNGCPHWSLTGAVTYRAHEEIVARGMVLRMWGIPVGWVPYWWQPLDTDYGWRFMPGYTSRWGAYALTKYVYTLAGSMDEGDWGLAGSTRLDVRTKNGVAVGQGVRWNLGDFGKGKFKVYYAWDEDADRYDKHWDSKRKWHYSNWGSAVPDQRYAMMFEHRWHPTERDTVRARASYYSDSHFRRDFLRDGSFGLDNRFPGAERNELAWEHAESAFALGASVAGPLNDFYGGVLRLPELWIDAAPQRLWSLPVNYESQTRFGWLDRNYAKHGKKSTAIPYRYDPGEWASYQAFRADTYHRLTAPFKVADVLAVAPRLGVRGTYWSDSGRENLTGYGRTRSTGDDVTRAIVEGGVTFSARASAWYAERWQHLFEPYLDVLAQEAWYSGLKRGARALYFDTVDGSADWLDQFAGRSRCLPYSWYGLTPGIRNAFRRRDDKGVTRTVFDIDFYAALQANDTSWTAGDRRHRLSRNQEKPNYGRDGRVLAAPGVRARWYPTADSALMARVEWDGQNDAVAYADVAWSQKLTEKLSCTLSYSARDQLWWDFSSTPYDKSVERNDDFNWTKFSYVGLELEQELCDAIAWGPFIRWDLRENELDEAGAWVDYRTDCLGFRFSLSYENDYKRIDGSEHGEDWRVGFGVYLRAFGPGSGLMFRE